MLRPASRRRSFVGCMASIVTEEADRRSLRAVARSLSSNLLDHVLDDVAVLALRAEHHDLGIGVDPDVVPGRPVEEVTCLDRLGDVIGVCRRQAPAEDIAPVRALAEAALQPLEERCRVDSGGEREVLAADRVETACVTEVLPLANHRSGMSSRTSTFSFATRILPS